MKSYLNAQQYFNMYSLRKTTARVLIKEKKYFFLNNVFFYVYTKTSIQECSLYGTKGKKEKACCLSLILRPHIKPTPNFKGRQFRKTWCRTHSKSVAKIKQHINKRACTHIPNFAEITSECMWEGVWVTRETTSQNVNGGLHLS